MNKVKQNLVIFPLLWRGAGVRLPILILIIVLVFASCKKDKLKTPEDYRVTVGRETLGLYLDGQPWIPNYRDAGNGVEPILVSMYDSYLPGLIPHYNYMWIRGLKGNEDFEIYLPPPLVVGRILLNSTTFPKPSILRPPAYGMYQIYSPSKRYMTTNIITGYVDIFRVDTMMGQIEGKFEFEAINSISQEKVKITNGYFNRNY